jgi:hypothetical protein
MRSGPDRRQHSRQRAFGNQRQVTVRVGSAARSSTLIAKLIDCSASGIRIELLRSLDPGITVHLNGEIDTPTGRMRLEGPCQVRWCAAINDTRFLAGLAFELPAEPENPQGGDKSTADGKASVEIEDEVFIDYYDSLQVARSADAETIRRLFHILVSRFHPDNLETGNADSFRKVVDAHEVLSDPDRRAAFDRLLTSRERAREQIVNAGVAQSNVESEIQKRQQILRMLYEKRIVNPHSPSLGVRDFEEAFRSTRERLEFSFWYLKESRFVTRSDNNRFEITVIGCAQFENEERRGGLPGYMGPMPNYAAQLPEAPQSGQNSSAPAA